MAWGFSKGLYGLTRADKRAAGGRGKSAGKRKTGRFAFYGFSLFEIRAMAADFEGVGGVLRKYRALYTGVDRFEVGMGY